MRAWAAVLAVLLCFATAPAAGAKPAPPGRWIEWPQPNALPQTIRVQDLTLRLSQRTGKDGFYAPVVVISDGKRPPRTIRSTIYNSFGFSIGVFRLDRRVRDPVVIVRRYTSGAHCCLKDTLAYRDGRRWRVTHLGLWDAGATPEPRDIDGDGRLELLGSDQRFNYQFTSYAGSVAPPTVYEVVGGTLIDVSASPRYRRLFREKLQPYREGCEGEREWGFCAAYAAASARTGDVTDAYALIDRRSGSETGWGVPEHCRPAGAGCSGPIKRFATLRQAVDWFLRDLGYLPREAGA